MAGAGDTRKAIGKFLPSKQQLIQARDRNMAAKEFSDGQDL
jgi:hypothetical protein